ncbi:hypothetical protein MKY66_16670 [Paenibacillus sp. FSL R5-0766]|uniref:hypothetical protein n=1 Tax=unclassified Paenibacillus TaxID=185978 RepID=UPI00117D62FE|nr:hypothetical protein [Paenibacillus sp. FSL R5-0765]
MGTTINKRYIRADNQLTAAVDSMESSGRDTSTAAALENESLNASDNDVTDSADTDNDLVDNAPLQSESLFRSF